MNDKLKQLRLIVTENDTRTGEATGNLFSVCGQIDGLSNASRTLGNAALADQLKDWADAIRRNTGDLYNSYRSLECLIEDKGEGNE